MRVETNLVRVEITLVRFEILTVFFVSLGGEGNYPPPPQWIHYLLISLILSRIMLSELTDTDLSPKHFPFFTCKV
jgi:hypothetical protein